MKKLGTGIGIGLLAIVLVFGLFLLASLVLMWLVNVVLGQYNIELLEYPTAMAITLLLSLFGGAVRGGSDK